MLLVTLIPEQSKQRVGDTPSALPPSVKKHLVAKHPNSAYATERHTREGTIISNSSYDTR